MADPKAKPLPIEERLTRIVVIFGLMYLMLLALVCTWPLFLSAEVDDLQTVVGRLLQDDGIRGTLYVESLASAHWKEQRVLEKMATHLREMEHHMRLELAGKSHTTLTNLADRVEHNAIFRQQEAMEAAFRETGQKAFKWLAAEAEARQAWEKIADDLQQSIRVWLKWGDKDNGGVKWPPGEPGWEILNTDEGPIDGTPARKSESDFFPCEFDPEDSLPKGEPPSISIPRTSIRVPSTLSEDHSEEKKEL
jgi:hypothetical protein